MAAAAICSNCGCVSKARKVAKGSTLIELVLWICFIIPGLIYSIWRMSSKQLECPKCHAKDSMVPLDSPRGAKLQRELTEQK